MSRLFRLESAVRLDPSVRVWFAAGDDELRRLAEPWFERMRGCGVDVSECLHDGHPTACMDGVAFGYVGAFRAHVNVGFFHGAELDDPARLLEGSGRWMRHVKLHPGQAVNAAALTDLIATAYQDIRRRLASAHWAS